MFPARPKWARFPRMRFSRQVLLLQIGVVVLVVGSGVALVSVLLRDTLTDQFGERARAIARSVAADPVVVADTTAKLPGGALQERALTVAARTDALFVVFTEDLGIRLAHPTLSEIGKKVSTSAEKALAGLDDVNTVASGTLGLSVRSKTPIWTPDHRRVVGEVSVGFEVAQPLSAFNQKLAITLLFAGGALLRGAGAAALLNRRLRRVTHGLEPHELTELLYEREAVLHGIGEGVLAVDEANRVSVRNDEAERLLGTELPIGAAMAELELSPRVHKAVAEGRPVDSLLAVAGNRVLVINSRVVRLDDRDIGTVLTFRDRTDLDTLTRELDGIRVLSDGLRAQRHEFANRLHTLYGLLQLGHHTEAVEYLQTLTDSSSARPSELGDAVAAPYLQALLVAKTAQAQEKGLTLKLADDTWVPTTVTAPIAANTVIGNLVDNALHAARKRPRRPATVEISLLAEGGTLHLSVVDKNPKKPKNQHRTLFD